MVLYGCYFFAIHEFSEFLCLDQTTIADLLRKIWLHYVHAVRPFANFYFTCSLSPVASRGQFKQMLWGPGYFRVADKGKDSINGANFS